MYLGSHDKNLPADDNDYFAQGKESKLSNVQIKIDTSNESIEIPQSMQKPYTNVYKAGGNPQDRPLGLHNQSSSSLKVNDKLPQNLSYEGIPQNRSYEGIPQNLSYEVIGQDLPSQATPDTKEPALLAQIGQNFSQ